MKKNWAFAGLVALFLAAALFPQKAPKKVMAIPQKCAPTCCQSKDKCAAVQDPVLDNLSHQFL